MRNGAEGLDVVALPLDEALAECQTRGLDVEIRKTYPAKSAARSEKWRVVRQTEESGKTILTAAEECRGVIP